MKRSYWISLYVSAMMALPCATALGQLSDAGSAFDLTSYQETPVDVQPVECGSCGDLQSSCQKNHSRSRCHKCLASRQYLFGDWHGMRSCLAKRGIIADLQLTQFYQGVASGGVNQTDAYGGKLDYQFTFLGEPLGLWKGFTTIMHAETRFGEAVNADAGAFAFPNVNMLYPLPGRNDTAITGFLLMQALNERWALAAGKFNAVDLWHMLYPNTGRGIDGFMNLSMVATPAFLRTTNLSINGAGLLRMEGKQIQSGVLVYDTNNSTTTTGISNLFDQGSVVFGYWRFFTEMNGLPGSHAFLGNYSNRKYTSVDPLSWTVIPGQGLTAGVETGSWTLAYVLDQMLWVDRCNDKRNLRFVSQWALADANPSPIGWTFNVALQGQGLVCCRENDTMGVGYFYDELSGGFKQIVSTLPTVDLEDVQGVELYYNAAVRPWFHLTGDLQVIDNENVGNDPAFVLGLRANIVL
jgi:porin